jgi:segregation and condensation protein B
MLEVLSIIIYKGPIGKVGIEKIRGVNSDLILRKLTIKGLIEKEEHIENSKIFIYKPSLKLFKKLGISRLENLSEYAKLSSELKNLG